MNEDVFQKIIDVEKPQTASANVYDDLRREIIELTLKPGAIISIKDMCEHFGTSRSPVRDALIRLEQEGLITTLPQRGTMISKIDFSRVEQERFMRVCVEEQVMNEFITKHKPEDIIVLEELLVIQKEAAEEKDNRRFLEADENFHNIFYIATDKGFCAKTIQQISGHYKRFRLLTTVDKIISEDVIEQHRQILNAVKEKDVEKMHQVLKKHFYKIHDEEIIFCKKYPDIFNEENVWEHEQKFWSEDFLTTLKK